MTTARICPSGKEVNGRLEYRCPNDSWTYEVNRPWILTEFPYNKDWEMQIDVTNNMQLTDPEWTSFGIGVISPYTSDNIAYAELYASGGGHRFYADVETTTDYYSVQTGDLGVTTGAVRLSFDSTNKVISVSYDTDPSDGYQWVSYGSFDIDGSGNGTYGSVNWGLTATDKLLPFVYGYSQWTKISGGHLYGDNFQETGGVAPPLPIPSVPEGTIGTQLTLTGTNLGAKGKVLIGGVATKVTNWTDTSITCLVTKVPPAGGPYNITITPQKAASITLSNAFTVKYPEIDSLNSYEGAANDPIIITGNFFSTKKGKVYLGDQVSGKRKNCKVTSWGMESITFVVPKTSKSFPAGTYFLDVVNKIGVAEASSEFTID
jgi:hypothetical protein